jgi:hypothetical protein
VDESGTVVPSWLDSFGSSFVMSDITSDRIWSSYTTSPDPAAGTQSLYQMCTAITKHVLLPSHIVLSGGGFTLLPELAQVLLDAVPLLGQVLNRVMRLSGLPGAQCFCQLELGTLTCTTGMDIATQNQVVRSWVNLVDKVYIAMTDIKYLAGGRPIHVLGRQRPSRMYYILAALSPSLLVKLPADFLQSYGISIAKAQGVVCQIAEREHSCSRSSPYGSRTPRSCAEAGGLASPQATAANTAASAAKFVSTTVINAVAEDAPRAPSPSIVVAPDMAPAIAGHLRGEQQCVSAMPTWGLDRPRVPPRDESVYPSIVSMADLGLEYTAGPDSVFRRATSIVAKGSLDDEDVADRGNCSHIGRFSLKARFFVRVDNTVTEMQALLTKASSLAGRSSHFIVDPHRTTFTTLQGAGGVAELHCAWDGLVKRLRITQSTFELYQQGCTDPERKACDSAARTWLEQGACEDITLWARQTAGAQKHRGRPDVAQVTTGGVPPPVTSLLSVDEAVDERGGPEEDLCG